MNCFLKSKQSFRKIGGSAFYRKITSINNIRYKLLFFFLLISGIILLYITKIGCVWKFIFGICCPGCGMTRAFLALLHKDIILSLKYHFMLFSLPVLGLYILFDGRPFKNKKINAIILIAILIGFFIRWILCIFGVLPA